jgi:hypothetical protein
MVGSIGSVSAKTRYGKPRTVIEWIEVTLLLSLAVATVVLMFVVGKHGGGHK